MAVRAPHLYQPLRCFCLGAFNALAGADVPFAFEEHPSFDGPALYEYRPLVRGFVETRRRELRALRDAQLALDDLRREPAAAIFARAHAGAGPGDDEALFGSILLPLVASTADRCGGFDWHDDAFASAYGELEHALFGAHRLYAAVAPLVGISAGSAIDLGAGIRVRVAASGELAKLWPEAQGLLPPDFGRETDRLCVLELERDLPPGEPEPPDAPAELADAVSALRLATAGPIAAGPVIFERLDWRPLAVRPLLPIAGTQPPGEPTRLDAFRGRLAQDLRERLVLADLDRELAEALDRWELSLFADEPFRSGLLRESLSALLGDGSALRASILLGETTRERSELLERLRTLVGGGAAGRTASDALRRALVETLLHGNRAALAGELDEALLGLRPRPAGYLARAVA